ncbi:MAG: hypothetical protein N2544_12850 [Burkholderiales bacterium]|nr:hypothetical protein [Burkholderiales bacterium]
MRRSRRTLLALAAASLVVAACGTPGTFIPDERNFAGVWVATLPAASGGGERTLTLSLNLDSSATLATRFSGREGETADRGSWSAVGLRVTVSLATADDRRAPQRLVFELRGQELVPVDWNRALWGEAGPGTYRRR